MVNPKRFRVLTPLSPLPAGNGPVVCWIQRDRRCADNWALLRAMEHAKEQRAPVIVVFCLASEYLDATWRQYHFLLVGLQEWFGNLSGHNISSVMLLGTPNKVLPRWLKAVQPSVVVTDIEPLRNKQQWAEAVAQQAPCCVEQVDAHNVVPVWHASPKAEFGAYTLRPKLNKLYAEFLVDFPVLERCPFGTATTSIIATDGSVVQWNEITTFLTVDTAVQPIDWLIPGERAGYALLQQFTQRINVYNEGRNNPNERAQSNLSPYFHFGMVAPQRAALLAKQCNADAFFEELVVRRELADNFTFYNPNYDSILGFHPWAQATLHAHRGDTRDHTYTLDQWQDARTHDQLWNAAQAELVTTGKLHGYMRMYWAKKILEWSELPEEALHIALYLNDKYELDGRDPNGYTGVAWSIGGVHDRAWAERPVYGKIRYMNANGCARKFDVPLYIRTHLGT
jgi:deoxyribodipyrimidine photo-lyase